MKLNRCMELLGSAAVLFGLLIQVFVLVEIEGLRQETEDMILSQRLSHIYGAIKNEEPASPKWDDIEVTFSGPDEKGDNIFRFSEVERFLKFIAGLSFVLGAALALVGKWRQFTEEENKSSKVMPLN